nr:MarR family transcriptional regulator [uncultured Xylophilus sp.]
MLEPPRALEDLLLYRLSRLQAVAGGMVLRLCEGRFGITRREWRLLLVLADRGTLGSSALADAAQLDRARTSRAIGSLVEKQLVARTAMPGDRRQVMLALTAEGRRLHAQLFPLVARLQHDLLAALDPAAVAALDAALARLQAQAEALAATAALPKANRRRRPPVAP